MEGKPFIHYGVTKKASEEYCKIFKGTYGLDTVNLRLFYAMVRDMLLLTIVHYQLLKKQKEGGLNNIRRRKSYLTLCFRYSRWYNIIG